MTDLTRRRFLEASGVAGVGLLGVETAAAQSTDSTPIETWAAGMHIPTASTYGEAGIGNQTLRQVVHPSVGGSGVSVRLANTFGEQSVTFDSVTVGVRDSGADVVADTLTEVTFGGSPGVTIDVGNRVSSDTVSIDVQAHQDLVVSYYAPSDTGQSTTHQFGRDDSYIASGDATAKAKGGVYKEIDRAYYFLDGVDVFNSNATGAVVTLGDSITEGVGSNIEKHLAYPEVLSQRIADDSSISRSVVNGGISGNRILHDSPANFPYGEKALDRLDRDVFAQSGVTDVILFEGINDIGHSAVDYLAPNQEVSAQQIIDGMKEIVSRTHDQGLKIHGATLTPFKSSAVYTEKGEEKRQKVNDYIRSSGEFDSVFDFDEALRNSENPDRLDPDYDSGDGLHPNNPGHQKLAETVDLEAINAESTSGGSGGKVPGFTATTAIAGAAAAAGAAYRRYG